MLFWDEKLAGVLKVNNIHLDDGMRYMDDVRLVLDALHEAGDGRKEDCTIQMAGRLKMRHLENQPPKGQEEY